MIKQISNSDWIESNFITRAILEDNPEELALKYNIKFSRNIDDLDYFDYAYFSDNKEKFMIFERYINNPTKGTEILIKADIIDYKEKILMYLNELDIKSKIVWWYSE